MLCSDGFWESVEQEEVSHVLSEYGLEDAAEHLVQLASERGGSGGDNISLAMAQLGQLRKKFRWFS